MDNLRDFTSQTGTEAETSREHTRLGHFRLERELGRGFSSVVYEAADERRQRLVALKVLTFSPSLSEERRVDLAARFRREAQAVSALSHPNIVAIYEVGQADDGRQYIAMECLPGETLRQRLHHTSPLSVPEAVAIAVRVADALHYAHGRGIVHRDVKPDNIFLARRNGPEDTPHPEDTPKLMDFGIAHLVSDQGLTQDGTIVGSPAYMSPEQINGQPLDARTDIFSLAVTLTEMVAGAKPFEGDSVPAVMQKILRHAPELRAVPNRRLERVLAKALSKNPGARYPDAAAFADALRQATPLAAAAPSVATQFLTGPPLRPAAGSRKRRYAALGAVGLALTALAALPLATRRPPLPVSVSPAFASPVTAALPASSQPIPSAAPVRLAVGVRTRRHEAGSVRHRSTMPPDRPAQSHDMVQIVEATPVRHHSSYYAPTAPISSVIQPPKPSRTPAPPRMALASLTRPVVRVAGVRQELTPANRDTPSAIPETEPTGDKELPLPPRAPVLADAPPRPIHCPMPSALADIDGTDATVRLQLSVDKDGDVTEANILTSSGSRALDDAALDAVGQWEYAPAVQGGRSVAAVITETVKFSRE